MVGYDETPLPFKTLVRYPDTPVAIVGYDSTPESTMKKRRPDQRGVRAREERNQGSTIYHRDTIPNLASPERRVYETSRKRSPEWRQKNDEGRFPLSKRDYVVFDHLNDVHGMATREFYEESPPTSLNTDFYHKGYNRFSSSNAHDPLPRKLNHEVKFREPNWSTKNIQEFYDYNDHIPKLPRKISTKSSPVPNFKRQYNPDEVLNRVYKKLSPQKGKSYSKSFQKTYFNWRWGAPQVQGSSRKNLTKV